MTSSRAEPVAVLYEDRPDYLIGLQLALLSLGRHAPNMRVFVTAPAAGPEMRAWVRQRPNVEWYDADLDPSGWDVKPTLLLRHLQDGRDNVVWLDTDIIVTGDLSARLDAEPPSALVASEDVWWAREQGTAYRTLALGLEPGRVPQANVNTGVVRVRPHHAPFLEAWQEVLASDEYRHSQSLPWSERPLYLWGDQEVFTGLIGARRWDNIDLHLLRRGVDVAQCYGAGAFSPSERVAVVRAQRPPVLVHAMGPKPWLDLGTRGDGLAARVRELVADSHNQLSLYTLEAAHYLPDLPGQLGWTKRKGAIPAVLCRLAGGQPALAELPMSVVGATISSSRRAAGRARRSSMPRWALRHVVAPGRGGGG